MAQRLSGTATELPIEVWPPDDTEESVVGTNLHHETIRNVCAGLNEVASLLAPPGGPAPWHAFSQTELRGLQHPDGSPYNVLPDVFVYDHPIDDRRPSLALAAEGTPLLVVEVLSRRTYRRDLDRRRGKGYSYARAGVPEYLLLDPTGEYLPEQGQGWRLETGGYAPWEREADGRWRSRRLGVAIAFEGVRVVVYDPDGRRQLREGEVARELARREREHAQELADKDAELARQEQAHVAELEALRRRLRELTGE